MEPAPARGESRRTQYRPGRQRQYEWADSQKNILKPHLKQQWVIAPEANSAFVANMEDVLEVYQRPRDPERPVVCLDETSKQLILETRAAVPAKPGRKARHDYEYERNGVANLFMLFAPLEGWRRVKVTDRLVERFEWHYTPKHGSWLDMAESELGVLATQCLDRRIPNKQTLAREVSAWQDNRNKHHAKADWQFTTADARVKLKRLYPRFE